MQLTTDQIKLGILHADREVREAALLAFRQSFSTDPAVMPLLIQAIEQYGWQDVCFPFYKSRPFAQTAETVDWLIKWLKEPESHTDNVSLWKCWQRFLSRQLGAAPTEILQPHAGILAEMPGLEAESFENIAERIRLAALDRDEFLRELNEYCQESANEEMPIDLAEEEQARYAEAFVQIDPNCGERVLEQLSEPLAELLDSDAQNWMQVIATQAAGRLQLADAIPLLLEGLEADANRDGDWYCEVCADALIRIGSDDVIRLIENRFRTVPFNGRMVESRILEGIRSELAARTAVSLFAGEEVDYVQEGLADALLAQFDEGALAKAREHILAGEADSGVEDYLIGKYVAASTLMNLPLGDLEPWRARAAESSERFRSHLLGQLTEDGRLPSEFEAELDQLEREYPLDEIDEYEWGLFDDEDEDLDELEDEEEDEEDEPNRPIMHFEPKVGRNDPCPCGSGKKFKKCCMNKPKPPIEW